MRDIHGGDIYSHRVDYDFSVNLNPLGMPKTVIEAAQRGVLQSNHYPDVSARALRRAMEEELGIPSKKILVGNGAAELIYGICYALRPKRGLVAAPGFAEYEAALRCADARITYWNLREEEEFQVGEGILSAIGKEGGVLFLCNPGNPVGNLIDPELMDEIAQKCERTGTILCVDECFLPFVSNEERYSMLPGVKQNRFQNLIVLRAFTKIYAMAGLRLGFAVTGNERLLTGMRESLQPWNTSIPAQLAGIEALQEKEYLVRTRRVLETERKYLTGEMEDGLAEKVYPGAANYIFFRCNREDLQEQLLQEGILIRSCENYRNLGRGFFRIGIRTHEENRELIRRWRKTIWQRQL